MLIRKWRENKEIRSWFIEIRLNRLSLLAYLSWSQKKACLQSIVQQPKQWSQTKLFWCSLLFACHAKQMQRWAGKASACYIDEQGTAGEIGGVRCAWKGQRWWLKPCMWRSADPACFTTERHCRWEGRVRRGLRARRHTHTPPDRDTRSRRGRQPLRTPREGRTALWGGQFIHFDLGLVIIRQPECVWVPYMQIQEICQAYTQGPKLTKLKIALRQWRVDKTPI